MSAGLSRIIRDGVTRLGFATPAFWVYGAAAAAHPGMLLANARLRRKGAPDGLPIPPSDLIYLVAGTTDAGWFLEGGMLAAQTIREALAARHQPLESARAVLDFGCGCGRVLRHLKGLTGTRVCGTDSNPRLVKWVLANLAFVDAAANRLAPPLEYGTGTFDAVYAMSVFTHLTQDLQGAWFGELARVTRPGGHILVSTHGDAYLERLTAAERRIFEAGELVVKNNTKAPGSNTCAAYHPRRYFERVVGPELELVDFVARGARGNPLQDLVVLRRRQP